MRLSVLFLIVFSVSLTANSYSQTHRLTIEKNNVTIAEVFSEIEEMSEFSFLYSPREVDVTQHVSVKVENVLITDILSSILDNKDIAYRITDRHIVLYKADDTAIKKSDFAQQSITITGTVFDADGETLPGVSIQVRGTTLGTISNVDGAYSINVSNNQSIIEFSYTGFSTVTEMVGDRRVINPILTESTILLDEVVVVGYGTMRRKDVTGSVVQVRPDNVTIEAPKTIQDILRGTPGLRVDISTSAKGGGSMEIRGDRSVSSASLSSPLLILDGMPFYGELSEINPNDIGQVDILKDASAAAVFGAKAANGVIIITTKKGKMGKPTINFRVNFGLDTKAAYSEWPNPEEYMKYLEDWYETPTYGKNQTTGRYEAYQTGAISNGYYRHPGSLPEGVSLDAWRAYSPVVGMAGEEDIRIYARRLGLYDVLLDNYMAGRTFNWADHCFRTGINSDYNISISGAGDRMNYYMSAGYANNESARRGDKYNTVRVNMKLTGTVNDWLEIGGNVNFQERSDDSRPIDFASATRNSPYANFRDKDGNLDPFPHGTLISNYRGWNWDFEEQYNFLERGYSTFNSIFTSKITLPFNITYSFNISPRYQFYYNRYFQSAEHPNRLPANVGADRTQRKRFEWSLNNTINWDYTFVKKHHINLTLVQEAEEFKSWEDEIRARNLLPTDALGFHNTQVGGKLESSFSSSDEHHSAAGLMGRLFYSFDERYMFTATIRRDGYSGFGINNPYATFPSFAASWTFTNERFFRWDVMNTGKLRLSWGQNGNRSLSNPYIALSDLRLGSSLYGYLGSSGSLSEVQFLYVNRLGNPNMSWEKSEAINFGLDYGFLNNQITGSIEGYTITTRNMIMNKSLPAFTGFSQIATNLGEVVNSGFELSISSQNIKRENLVWNTTFNLSYNKNKIKHLYYEYEDVLDNAGNVIGQKERDEYGRWFIGEDISTIWNYRVIGIWQPDEIEEAAKSNQKPGDPKVANTYTADDRKNADGTTTPVYNDYDKEFLGKTAFPLFWQMRNNFTLYKHFEFSFNIYSNWGAKFSDTNYLNVDNYSNTITSGAANIVKKEFWTPDNLTNNYARLNALGPTGAETPPKYRDGSFIRLENISLGYNLPKLLLSKWNISNAQIYANIRNVAIWEKEKYYYGDVETKGFLNRVYTLGLNITL